MRIVALIPLQGGPKNTPKPNFFEKRKKIIQNTKTQNVQKYAEISDTPFDQRSLIHREAWFPGEPRIPKNLIFLKNGKHHPNRKNSKKYAKISDMPFDQRSLIYPEAWFPRCFVRQKQPKKLFFLFGNFRPLRNKKCSNLRPLLSITFPKGLQIS